jgi:transcription initiation factor TFIIIB Brf1 subunit/transcription initiation factor TFIIB
MWGYPSLTTTTTTTTTPCIHTNTIDNDGSSEVVCMDCGHVIDICFSASAISPIIHQPLKQNEVGIDFIENMCANQPWLTSITADSILYYKKILKDSRVKTVCRQDLAAFAIYRTARGAEYGILPRLVDTWLGSNAKQLLRLEQLFPNDVADDDPCFYLSGIGLTLGIGRRELVELRAILQHLNGNCFGKQPRTIAAASIFLFYVTKNPKKHWKHSLKHIAKSCNISPRSICRVLPFIRKELPDAFPAQSYDATI